jgi:hypothetical protein
LSAARAKFVIKIVPRLSKGHSESIEEVKEVGFIKETIKKFQLLGQRTILDAAERATFLTNAIEKRSIMTLNRPAGKRAAIPRREREHAKSVPYTSDLENAKGCRCCRNAVFHPADCRLFTPSNFSAS